MTKKSEPEKSEEGEAGKPAARKGAVRKTIRRVRKAAPRREKISGNEEESHPKEVVIPIVQTTEPETSKPDALDAPEPVEADERPERGSQRGTGRARESEREGQSRSDPPRRIGRVPKGNVDEDQGPADERSAGREDRRGGGDRRGRGRRGGSRTKPEPVDAKALARKAWKLYQADIAEEGIALVDDKAGRHLAMRSFDLARIFLEEVARQTRNGSERQESGGEE